MRNKLLLIPVGLAIVFTSAFFLIFPKRGSVNIAHTHEQEYINYISAIDNLSTTEIEKVLTEKTSEYAEVQYDSAGFSRAYIASSKIELYNRELVTLCHAPEYDEDRATFLRTELRRLSELKLLVPVRDANYGYNCPADLVISLLNFDNVHITQTMREHISANGFWAIDIGTGGVREKIYAPSLWGKEYDWEVHYDLCNNSTVGKCLTLYAPDMKVLIGHVNDWNGKAQAHTGEELGLVGGCNGDDTAGENLEGVSTGCHLHIEISYWIDGVGFVPIDYEEKYIDRHAPEKDYTAPNELSEYEQRILHYSGENCINVISENWYYITEKAREAGVKPSVAFAIANADTGCGHSTRSSTPSNYWNVGNTATSSYEPESWKEGYRVFLNTMNGNMGKYDRIGELSVCGRQRLGLPSGTIYASSDCSGFWNTNVLAVISELEGESADESFNFRIDN